MKLPLLKDELNDKIYDSDIDTIAVVFSKDNLNTIVKMCNLFPELVEALELTGKWMEFWLEEDLCDCEGVHICGKTERKKELKVIKELLEKSKH